MKVFEKGQALSMIELVEAIVLTAQLNKTIKGKKIKDVIAMKSPHKFAFFHGEPDKYPALLTGQIVKEIQANGGQIEMKFGDISLVFGDGVGLRYYEKNEKKPDKHQLLIEFKDQSSLIATVQMYGFLWCFQDGEFDNPYYLVAKEKPSPLSEEFDRNYFDRIVLAPGMEKLSAKALLATEQRIPGLGNGVLQDILYHARIHPKKKVKDFSEIS
jgi:formamidopyrimidine-DNA glycosylase